MRGLHVVPDGLAFVSPFRHDLQCVRAQMVRQQKDEFATLLLTELSNVVLGVDRGDRVDGDVHVLHSLVLEQSSELVPTPEQAIVAQNDGDRRSIEGTLEE